LRASNVRLALKEKLAWQIQAKDPSPAKSHHAAKQLFQTALLTTNKMKTDIS